MSANVAAVALHLHAVEGHSHRRIAAAMGCSHTQVQRLIRRATQAFIADAAEHGRARAMALFAARYPDGDGINVFARQRQGELYDRLEERLEERERRLELIAMMMGSEDAHQPRLRELHEYDRWELAELARRGTKTLPASAYEARSLDRYVVTQ